MVWGGKGGGEEIHTYITREDIYIQKRGTQTEKGKQKRNITREEGKIRREYVVHIHTHTHTRRSERGLHIAMGKVEKGGQDNYIWIERGNTYKGEGDTERGDTCPRGDIHGERNKHGDLARLHAERWDYTEKGK